MLLVLSALGATHGVQWPSLDAPCATGLKYMASAACVLHYACYNVEALWVRWRRGMDNYRLGGREHPPPLHAQVCKAADEAFARGGEAAARRTVLRFFEECVMFADKEEVELQRGAKVCVRIGAPSRLLAVAGQCE